MLSRLTPRPPAERVGPERALHCAFRAGPRQSRKLPLIPESPNPRILDKTEPTPGGTPIGSGLLCPFGGLAALQLGLVSVGLLLEAVKQQPWRQTEDRRYKKTNEIYSQVKNFAQRWWGW